MIEASREHLGWVLHESGPESADRIVLLLPGALCTAAFYNDLLAEPSMSKAPIRFVATTVPGFGGTAPPADMSTSGRATRSSPESWPRILAATLSSAAASVPTRNRDGVRRSRGRLVLLSPSFSRSDESRVPRALDRLSRVLGHLPYSLMLKIIGPAMKSGLPPTRREALIAELKKNDPHFVRRQTHLYLEYLDRHGSLAPRFADSGVPAWVVLRRSDDVGITNDERDVLRGESSREHRQDLRRRTLHPQPAARRDRQTRPRGGNKHGAPLRGMDVGWQPAGPSADREPFASPHLRAPGRLERVRATLAPVEAVLARTGSTAAATASSTGRCTSSPCNASATTPRRPPTTSGSSLQARPPGKHAAASSVHFARHFYRRLPKIRLPLTT